MPRRLTIVMYHFVRDLANSRFPRIRGLTRTDFIGQLKYIARHYTVIRAEDLVAAVQDPSVELPPRALLLTFDDGYLDHFLNVFPLLDEMGWQGCFFPPGKAIVEKQVLDVNKIHFVLASTGDPRELLNTLFSELDKYRREYGLESNDFYYEKLATDGRYDSPDVLFVKRMLQRELPEELRSRIVDELFRKYVTEHEAAFARELYMDDDQLRCLIRHGMYVGSHSYEHVWLNTLDPEEQERQIDLSLDFLAGVGAPTTDWIMCYPYGGYNGPLTDILHRKGCGAGLAVDVDIADLNVHEPMTLPRLDTNDLPKKEDARVNEWAVRAGLPAA
jgi:peptidoglycan/xylan/chitin deacetylase (PgdA/CDA1 family)